MNIKSRIGTFFSQYPEVFQPKATVIINGGDWDNQAFYLEQGIVKEYYISQTGNLFIVNMYNSGSFFPTSLLNTEKPEADYFDTITPCVLRIAPCDVFSEFITSDNELLKVFTGQLLQNLADMTRRLGIIASGNAYQRTASTLAYIGRIIGKSIGGNGGVIIDEPVMSHKEIAGWVGTARETTSIQMKLLEKKGLVSYQGRKIIINDLHDLFAEAGLN
jgi:CRP-like cAMP-binding protein